MSNAFYNIGLQDFAQGLRSWPNDAIKFQLLSANYVFAATHTSMDDVPVGDRIIAPQSMLNRNADDGYLVSDPVLFQQATDPTPVAAVVIYYEDPSLIDANHRLILYLDQAGGLPLTLDGTDQFFAGSGPNGAWARL